MCLLNIDVLWKVSKLHWIKPIATQPLSFVHFVSIVGNVFLVEVLLYTRTSIVILISQHMHTSNMFWYLSESFGHKIIIFAVPVFRSWSNSLFYLNVQLKWVQWLQSRCKHGAGSKNLMSVIGHFPMKSWMLCFPKMDTRYFLYCCNPTMKLESYKIKLSHLNNYSNKTLKA